MPAAKDLDVVLFGATGFTGRQTADYFARHAPPGLKWAVAARSEDKLRAVRDSLGPAAASVEAVVADGTDPAAMTRLAARARVVLTTAGPFAKYGDALVAACVAEKTHYVDITGESPWVRTVIDRFHAKASAEGTRIVPCCGFDSVPSDLGVWLVTDYVRREWGQPTVKVQGSFSMKGGLNGGTVASVLNLGNDAAAITDVLLLNPETHRGAIERGRSADRRSIEWSADLDRWLCPFFMAAVNTRVVRRSNALFDDWGEGYARPALVGFVYDEAMETRSRWTAWSTAVGLGLGFRILGTSVGRRLVKRLAPAPGEGPSEDTMNRGFFRARFVGEAADGRKVRATIAHDGDPGNRSTVKMLCEAALLLATSPPAPLPGGPERGGVLTPATALGRPYADRLRAAGMTLEVEPM